MEAGLQVQGFSTLLSWGWGEHGGVKAKADMVVPVGFT